MDHAALPPLNDVLGSLRVVALPMATKFRGTMLREAALFEGPEGWVEFSPFPEYDDAEAATWLASAIDDGWAPALPLLRDRIPVNATVPAVPASAVGEVLARFEGCRTAKVKVAEAGGRLADDVARVREVRSILGPDGRVRIDANAAWNLDEAEHAIRALESYDLEYVEQPCATVEELAEIRRRIAPLGIPVAADESIRRASDPLAVARAGAADIIVIKAQPLGGIRRALDIVAQAGLPAVVSSALDTAVGLSLGARLAASLPTLDYDCGLGTSSLFVTDVADASPREGSIGTNRVVPYTASHRADGEREDWWRARLERCYRTLEESSA